MTLTKLTLILLIVPVNILSIPMGSEHANQEIMINELEMHLAEATKTLSELKDHLNKPVVSNSTNNVVKNQMDVEGNPPTINDTKVSSGSNDANTEMKKNELKNVMVDENEVEEETHEEEETQED